MMLAPKLSRSTMAAHSCGSVKGLVQPSEAFIGDDRDGALLLTLGQALGQRLGTARSSNADRPVLTRTVGTTNASPPRVTDATAEPVSASQAATASRGARSAQRALARAPTPADSSSAAYPSRATATITTRPRPAAPP